MFELATVKIASCVSLLGPCAENLSVNERVLYVDIELSAQSELFCWQSLAMLAETMVCTLMSVFGGQPNPMHWNYDGSAIGQAPGEHAEALKRPARSFPDPFRGCDELLMRTTSLEGRSKTR